MKDETEYDLIKGVPKEEDVAGIFLGSGKVVSLDILNPSVFAEHDLVGYPEERMIIDFSELAKKDIDGQTSTDYLNLFCEESGLITSRLRENEYLPGVGELIEFVGELENINKVRDLLGLNKIKDDNFIWSSTIRSEFSIWCVKPRQYGGPGIYSWAFGYIKNSVIPFIAI